MKICIGMHISRKLLNLTKRQGNKLFFFIGELGLCVIQFKNLENITTFFYNFFFFLSTNAMRFVF